MTQMLTKVVKYILIDRCNAMRIIKTMFVLIVNKKNCGSQKGNSDRETLKLNQWNAGVGWRLFRGGSTKYSHG